MNTACEFQREALPEHAAGRLDRRRAADLEAHLAGCADCRGALDVVRAVRAAPVEVPAGLEARLMAAAREVGAGRAAPGRAPWRGRWAPWAVPLAAAAALAAIWMGVSDPPDATPDRAAAVASAETPYGALPASDIVVAGHPVLADLTDEELARLLEEMES